MPFQRRRSTVFVGLTSLVALIALLAIAVAVRIERVGHAADGVRYPDDPTLPFRVPVGPHLFGSPAAFWGCLAAAGALLVWALFWSAIVGRWRR